MFQLKFKLEPEDNHALQMLVGYDTENIRYIENNLDVEISGHSFSMSIIGEDEQTVQIAKKLIVEIYAEIKSNQFDPEQTNVIEVLEHSILHIQQQLNSDLSQDQDITINQIDSDLVRGKIKYRNQAQRNYIDTIKRNAVTFGVGPAGTGKTFLAVAYAIDSLINENIDRIFVTRPLVEAGEQIGFLPGDIKNKLDPYLKPIFDSFSDIISSERATLLMDKGIIEISPLAYMRGRTFNNAVVILDEAQNTTPTQMKLILTRIGYNCKIIINGDLSQIDLQGKSGLHSAIEIFSDISKDISIFQFTREDIVRSRIAKMVVSAYETYESLTPIQDYSKPAKTSIREMLAQIQQNIENKNDK